MKINFVSYDIPYPLTSGGKIRAYYLLKALRQDYEVVLFSYYREESQRKHIGKLKKELGLSEVRLYKRRWIWHPLNLWRAALSNLPLLSISYLHPQLRRDLLEQSGLFHFESFGPSVYLPLIKEKGAACIFGGENVEWQIYQKIVGQRSLVSPLRPFMQYDVSKMRRFEHQLYKAADVNLGVSEGDCSYIRRVTHKRCFLVRNGVDLKKLSPLSKKNRSGICFGGDLLYQQNADGLQWFLREVWPHLREKPPVNLVTLTKPGWLDAYQVRVFDKPNVFAPRVYAQAAVFIAPIRVGGGTNIKILEALAVKTPVVTTSHGANSIGAKDGRHLLVADTPQKFAGAVVKLLESKTLRDRISRNGYEFVSKNYSWQAQGEKLRQIYKAGIVSLDS